MMRPAASSQEYILANAGLANAPTSNSALAVRYDSAARDEALAPRARIVPGVPRGATFSFVTPLSAQEVEIAAQVGLRDALGVQTRISTPGHNRRRKNGTAPAQLVLSDQKLERALLH
jgi:hypothetical protein